MISAGKKNAHIPVVDDDPRLSDLFFNKPLPDENFAELLLRGQDPVLSNASRMALLRED